ncbi:helix-turn-helix domain-containing protein [Aeromicrobium sp.]|uniref:helix-turn-helix domain-containing protein n=1 Tax=Aeromicrobium sp. TaxID=1871063 RepID=UPI003513FFFE
MAATEPVDEARSDRVALIELGQRVAARRAELGLSLATVAEAVGVHHSTLSRLERGQQDLGASHLPLLAEALGVEVGDLFSSSGFADHSE